MPKSDALPIVRVPMYAEAVLIVVVDKPPCKVVNPLAVRAATLVVPPGNGKGSNAMSTLL
jgi:hypothetical protein